MMRTVATPASVVVACLDDGVTFDVYARSDGTRTATVTAAVGAVHESAGRSGGQDPVSGSALTGLLPGPGTVALVVQHYDEGKAVLVGLA